MEYYAGTYEVIVIGAGHAGCEAGLAAARMGCLTLVLTISLDSIALMPCNPAVGGPAKGHLVREIDALGGEMGLNTDRAAIQMRLLNTGKGPAVQALRAQTDKRVYQENMREVLENQENLHLKQGLVERLLVDQGRVCGIVTANGARVMAQAVILTTGTYLRGRIFLGERSYAGGPNGHMPSVNLAEDLTGHGIGIKRFQTSTPPRIDGRTVDYNEMVMQPGDEGMRNISFFSPQIKRTQYPCWLTYTNEKTHEIIRANLSRSAVSSTFVHGQEPRYCPSIETKVVRFADKEAHQVFIEPEGKSTNEMYIQGLSTALPEEAQLAALRTMQGLEKVEITRAGYAIEYDYILPNQLQLSLETKGIAGLFTAGQVNGTSGYEEAAAQGIIAGINAQRYVRSKPPVIIDRSQGYIGVMIDDLVNKEIEEPYRMLTSRAEYRLLLRQDNADMRLTEIGREIGLVDRERYEQFIKKKQEIEEEKNRLERTAVPVTEETKKVLAEAGSAPLPQQGISLAGLLKRPEFNYRKLLLLPMDHPVLEEEIKEHVEIQVKYDGYIIKQQNQALRSKRMEEKKIPERVDYYRIEGLSNEAKEKLALYKPQSVGQASRISGVTPADISVLLVYLEVRMRQAKQAEAEQ